MPGCLRNAYEVSVYETLPDKNMNIIKYGLFQDNIT